MLFTEIIPKDLLNNLFVLFWTLSLQGEAGMNGHPGAEGFRVIIIHLVQSALVFLC